MQEKKVLLSIKDLDVKFRVRGRILTAIRGISLDIYENESIAIVGESGSGKSVFTKTFAGMLDSNGYVSNGKIIFNDEELADTSVAKNALSAKLIEYSLKKLNEYSKLEFGAETYKQILDLKAERKSREVLSNEEIEAAAAELKELNMKRAEIYNHKTTLNRKKDKEELIKTSAKLKEIDAKIAAHEEANEKLAKAKKQAALNDREYLEKHNAEMAALCVKHAEEITAEITYETRVRNEVLAKEIYLSVGRHGLVKRIQLINKLLEAMKEAMRMGLDLNDENVHGMLHCQIQHFLRFHH